MAIIEASATAQTASWYAESLRLTLFPAPGVTPNADSWWRELIGSDPETRTSKPATREHVDDGLYEGRRLQLTINTLGVIQWQILPDVPSPLDTPTGVFNVGPLQEVLTVFVSLMERWLPAAPASSRIAFGVTGVSPVAGHREGYEALGRLLRESVKLDPEGSSDFLYRINRPRPSLVIDGLAINRLSTWSVLKLRLLAEGPTGGLGRLVREAYACRAELDINTAATFQGTFDASIVGGVFQELQVLGIEILQSGDIP